MLVKLNKLGTFFQDIHKFCIEKELEVMEHL